MRRRTAHRLGQVDDRIHILEGRHIVFLNIDEVIRIIRESDEPKAALIARFALSDRQAEDILEIRLRQLARLEGIKIERELAELRTEKSELEALLGDEGNLKRLVIKEIRADAAKYGDGAAPLSKKPPAPASPRPCSTRRSLRDRLRKGWVRCRSGHGKSTRITSPSRTATASARLRVPQRGCPGGPHRRRPRPHGGGVHAARRARQRAPLASLVELPSGAKIAVLAGKTERRVLATSDGYGFLCNLGDMPPPSAPASSSMSVDEVAASWPPVLFDAAEGQQCGPVVRRQAADLHPRPDEGALRWRHGTVIMGLDEGETPAAACVAQGSLTLLCNTRGGK